MIENCVYYTRVVINSCFLIFQDTDTIFAYLSAILHLTDIQFAADHETDGVYIVDEYPLHVGR